jgi:ligand-binding sensor domain-containing protein
MTNLKSKISNDKWKWLMALNFAIYIPGAAYAIDQPLSVSMYIRDQWGAERGFPGGPVYAITQTADGYLWIGTEKGLIRFDGLNFRLIHISTPSAGAISGPTLCPTGRSTVFCRLAIGNCW